MINRLAPAIMNRIRYIFRKTGIFILLLFITGTGLFAQNPAYLCELRNDEQVDAKTFEFDVYLLRTGATPFEYASMQFCINLNPGARNGGTISVSLVDGSSQLTASQIPAADKFSFDQGVNCIIMTGTAPPGAGSGTIISNSTPGTRVGRIRLINTNNFGVVKPDLSWNFTAYPTVVNAYVGGLATDITVQSSHTNTNLANLTLNEPVTTYNVTGGGTYCEGDAGLPVGLSDSQLGVTYTLVKDNVPTATALEGTGSSISFGNQLAGTYTVSGENPTGSLLMNGQAVIINGTPVVTGQTATINSGATFSVTPSGPGIPAGTTYTWAAPLVNNGITGGVAQPVPQTTISGTLYIPFGTGTATYTVTPVSGSCTGETFNLIVTVNSTCTQVVITGEPADDNLCTSGTGASFSVVAGGTGPFTYQWQYSPNGTTSWANVANGTPAGASYTNQTTATLVVGGITTAGNYFYRCYVTNCGGGYNDTSNPAILTVTAAPSAPLIGTTIQPDCDDELGSVTLNGLPSTGTWTVNGTPGGISKTGTGTSTTIPLLEPDTYTFTVTLNGCTSPPSNSVTINPQPDTPTPPVVGLITPPTCILVTGSVALSGLPAAGEWTLLRYPGPVSLTGEGSTYTVTGLNPGQYNFVVINEGGCISSWSALVTIPSAPAVPSAPTIGTITQPSCGVPTGSVVLNSMPAGSWTITVNPGSTEIGGSTPSATVSGLTQGSYTFTVTNSAGCTSPATAPVVINAALVVPSAPVPGTVTQPTCDISTGSVPLSGLPASGTWIVTRSPGGTTTSSTGTTYLITGVPAGQYYFTVQNDDGCVSGNSTQVTVNAPPPLPAVPVQTVNCSLGAGNAIVTVTSPVGAGYQYQLDAGIFQLLPSFAGVANGNHTITVKNVSLCETTGPSFAVACGCAAPPGVTLSSTSGSTCGTTAVTVSNNTFINATNVTITDDGGGTVIPASTSTSPFSFVYTPVAADAGKIVTITVTTNNPLNAPCTAASATYSLTVNANPPAPTVGTPVQPTCSVPTGSVLVSNLPPTGSWILTRSPDNEIVNGSGPSTTVSSLNPGTYTFTVTNQAGCTSASSPVVNIVSPPSTPEAPVIGTITHPTCAVSTGSVLLSGLPSSGQWTVTRTPGGTTKTGTGSTTTITSIPSGTYTFTVRNLAGCISAPSEEVVINLQPETPQAPTVGTIAPPTCAVSTGSVTLLGLPSTGTWTLTRYPGTVVTTGTGTSTTVAGLNQGTYNFTVSNQAGCLSVPSANVVIPAQPPTPNAPGIGTITQPSFIVPTGSVVLTGLPSGTWTITRMPGEVITSGTGTNHTITGLPAGVFTFTVTNSSNCTSLPSAEVIISTPGKPLVLITDPAAVCSPSTVDLTAASVTEGSTPGLVFTYWTDEEASTEYTSPSAATTGTYYIKGTTVSGFFDVKPVVVIVDEMPVAVAGPDQVLEYAFGTQMEADLPLIGTGTWTFSYGSGLISDAHDPETNVTSLLMGRNELMWSVVNGVCPAAIDRVVILVNDLTIPTLITPNIDGNNDYFVIRGIESLGKTGLIIFDRRGMKLFEDPDYDNTWDGVDFNNNPLPDDTYYFILKTGTGKTFTGYIVVRR